MKSKLEIIQQYFKLLEDFSTEPADFEALLHSGFEQREFPNALNKLGQQSDLADSLRRAAVGKTILASQSFEITNSIEGAEQLVVEVIWRGKMARDAGTLKARQELSAHFCIVCEFKEGKIYRQRNYDCFDPL
jgi:hypothetical protein